MQKNFKDNSGLIEQARGKVAAAINEQRVVLYRSIGKQTAHSLRVQLHENYLVLQSLLGEFKDKLNKLRSTRTLQD